MMIFLSCIILIYWSTIQGMQQNWQDAAAYAAHATPQFRLACAVVDSHTIVGDRALDVGCGTGNMVDYLARHKLSTGIVIGIDSSPEMIAEATKRYRDLDNACFAIAAAEDFSFDEQFHLITIFSVLHWVKDHKKVFDNIVQHLAHDGLFMATVSREDETPTSTQIGGLMSVVLQVGLQSDWKEFLPQSLLSALRDARGQERRKLLRQLYNPLSERACKQLILESGLVPVSIKAVDDLREFESKIHFTQWLASWIGGISFIGAMPDDKRAEFVEQVVDAYVETMPLYQSQGIIQHIGKLLTFVAKKK